MSVLGTSLPGPSHGLAQAKWAALSLYYSITTTNWNLSAMTVVPSFDSAASPAPHGGHPAQGYAGDVTPQLAWQWVCSGQAVLVDVRTDAEREWVGSVPGAAAVVWKQWPGMGMNADFDRQLCAAVPHGSKVVLLCRSGVRSVAAARRATELGLEAYNILEGFEGALNDQAQRGLLGGWRWHGLPWRQG